MKFSHLKKGLALAISMVAVGSQTYADEPTLLEPSNDDCGVPPPSVDAGADLGEGFTFGLTTDGLIYHSAEPGHNPSFSILQVLSGPGGSALPAVEYQATTGSTYPRYEYQLESVEAGTQYTLEIRLQGNQFGTGQCIHQITVAPGEGVETSPCFTPPSSGGSDPSTPSFLPSVSMTVDNNQAVLQGGDGSSQPNFALYTFANDSTNVSQCFGDCAVNWPPLVIQSPEALIGAGGVTGEFATIERNRLSDDGCEEITEHQVTYNGDPLYFFIGDTEPGQSTGASIDGWDLATAELIPQMPVIPNPMPGLKTPVLGKQPGSHGFTFDVNGRNVQLRAGNVLQLVVHDTAYADGVGDYLVGIGDRGFEMYCSNNQVEWHLETLKANEYGVFDGTVPGSCYGKYWYFFRHHKRGPVNNDPESIWTYSALFEVDENNPDDRIDPDQRPTITDVTSNWFRFRHPHAQDGNTEAIFDSQNNSSLLSGLDRYTSTMTDGPNGVQLDHGVHGSVLRIEALETGQTPNAPPTYAFNINTCCGNAFDYGNVITYEMTAIAGSIDSQTYNTHQHYVVGLGFSSPLGDPRLTLAGDAATNMVFADEGSHVELEKDAVFTQHVTTLSSNQDVDDFLRGHHLFHGVNPNVQGSTALHEVLIGRDSCGNCHFRDGRGSIVVNTDKGPRVPPPVFGVSLLEFVEGAEAGFTWNGTVPTVREQIENALVADHGVSPASLGSDLDLIVQYTRLLTVPNREVNSYSKEGVAEGHVLFYKAGCADCHQENQRTRADAPAEFANLTISPFTDMKIHNVNGGSFRTAPLWGLGTNIRLLERNGRDLLLMHDGSATTIEGAINAHDGDASESRQTFNDLSEEEKTQLVDFIKTL